MSQGQFDRARYESDAGRIYNALVQPETLALTIDATANAAPAGAVTEEVSARMTGGKASIGMIARTVTLEWDGAPPTGYSGDNVIVPILTPALYATANPGVSANYLGAACTVVGRSPQRNR